MAMIDLWTERYRPTTTDEYVFTSESQRTKVTQWINDKSIPHLLLSGAAGVGKTTLAKLLVKEMGVDEYDFLYVNASRENGIDFIRNKIHPFCQTMPFGHLKIVMLDEADRVSQQGQDALKATMEEYAVSCRFILTTNHPNKILPPLHSRCQGWHFEKLDHTEYTARAATVLVTEGIEFDLDTLDSYVKAHYPDLRKCLNSLQQNSVTGKLNAPTSASGDDSAYRVKMVELYKEGKIREARKLICANISQDEYDDIYTWMYNNLELFGETDQQQDDAILVIRRALVNHSLVADPEINLAACLIELSQIQ